MSGSLTLPSIVTMVRGLKIWPASLVTKSLAPAANTAYRLWSCRVFRQTIWILGWMEEKINKYMLYCVWLSAVANIWDEQKCPIGSLNKIKCFKKKTCYNKKYYSKHDGCKLKKKLELNFCIRRQWNKLHRVHTIFSFILLLAVFFFRYKMSKKSPVCSLSLIKVLDCTLICFYNKTNTGSLLGIWNGCSVLLFFLRKYNLYKLIKYLKMFYYYIRLNFATKLDT